MLKAITALILLIPFTVLAERNVHFTGTFESGKILQRESTVDGFWIHTLPDPQAGAESISSTSGGFGPTSNMDTRVVPGELVGGELVRPRLGKYFMRSALHKDKDYSELNNGMNKPRSKIYVNGEGNKFDFDEEGYLGFSIYLPKSWEHETGVTDSRGTAQFLQVQSLTASWAVLALRVYVPKGDTEAHWFVVHRYSDTSVRDGKEIEYDLGRVRGDLGKWTDFVLRYRFNPFSVKTNASTLGGRDRIYEGNKGILQLWKANGAVDSVGNRQMSLTAVNLENKPVGLVPHATEKLDWHFRIYKYGWHRNPTDVKGPVWAGFDEIRDGRAIAHHTSYSDVHPARLACTDGCPDAASSAVRPAPPTDVAAAN